MPQEPEENIVPIQITQHGPQGPQGFEPIEYKTKLKVDKLYAGLPVFSTTPTYTGRQGETVLVDNGTDTRKICTYLNGTWYCNVLGADTGTTYFGTPEDFTTFSEVDPNGHITKTASRVTVGELNNDEDAYLYADKGVNYFNGDFTHYLDIRPVDSVGIGTMWCWMLTNDLDDHTGLDVGNKDFLAVTMTRKVATNVLYVQECDGGDTYNSTDYVFPGTGYGTTYYLTIQRVEADGDYGTLYVRIYSDSARTDLLATKSVVLHTSTKDYRYVFVVNSDDTGKAALTYDAYCENLII